MLKTLTGTLALALLLSTSASASELVKNGDFEKTPNGSDWSIVSSGGYSAAKIFLRNDKRIIGVQGGFAFLAGYNGGIDTISQTIDTQRVGSAVLTYDLSWFCRDSTKYDFLQVRFGNDLIDTFDLGSDDNADFEKNLTGSFSFDLTPYLDGTAKSLSFTGINDYYAPDERINQYASAVFIDNVSIQAQPVPEPSSLAALGLAGLALLRRRRKA